MKSTAEPFTGMSARAKPDEWTANEAASHRARPESCTSGMRGLPCSPGCGRSERAAVSRCASKTSTDRASGPEWRRGNSPSSRGSASIGTKGPMREPAPTPARAVRIVNRNAPRSTRTRSAPWEMGSTNASARERRLPRRRALRMATKARAIPGPAPISEAPSGASGGGPACPRCASASRKARSDSRTRSRDRKSSTCRPTRGTSSSAVRTGSTPTSWPWWWTTPPWGSRRCCAEPTCSLRRRGRSSSIAPSDSQSRAGRTLRSCSRRPASASRNATARSRSTNCAAVDPRRVADELLRLSGQGEAPGQGLAARARTFALGKVPKSPLALPDLEW